MATTVTLALPAITSNTGAVTGEFTYGTTVALSLTYDSGATFTAGSYDAALIWTDPDTGERVRMADGTGLTGGSTTLSGALDCNTPAAAEVINRYVASGWCEVTLVVRMTGGTPAVCIQPVTFRDNPYRAGLTAPTNPGQNTLTDAQVVALIAAAALPSATGQTDGTILAVATEAWTRITRAAWLGTFLEALRGLTASASTIVGQKATGGLAALTPAEARTVMDVDAAGTAQGLITSHTHAGTTTGPKLSQANTHESPDTDSATSALHHTLGTGANQSAAGNHTHAAYQPLATLTAAGSRYRATASGVVAEQKCLVALAEAGAGGWAPALTAGAHHTVTRSGIWTGITPSGLEIGEGCSGTITGAYATTTTGVTADWSGALDDIAGASVGWVIWREASGYRMACWTKA